MVSAPRMMQERRAVQILQIQKSIAEAREAGKDVNKKDIVLATMANLNLSKRTASEYVDVAMFNLR